MKKVLYSALAMSLAIGGVVASKANNNTKKDNRAIQFFRYIGPSDDVNFTSIANWTITSSTPNPICSGTLVPCQVQNAGVTQTVAQFAAGNTHTTLNAAYSVKTFKN